MKIDRDVNKMGVREYDYIRGNTALAPERKIREAEKQREIIKQKLLSRVKAGNIICLHDGRGSNEAPKRTIKALEKVIPILLYEGYKFKTIEGYEKQYEFKN